MDWHDHLVPFNRIRFHSFESIAGLGECGAPAGSIGLPRQPIPIGDRLEDTTTVLFLLQFLDINEDFHFLLTRFWYHNQDYKNQDQQGNRKKIIIITGATQKLLSKRLISSVPPDQNSEHFRWLEHQKPGHRSFICASTRNTAYNEGFLLYHAAVFRRGHIIPCLSSFSICYTKALYGTTTGASQMG